MAPHHHESTHRLAILHAYFTHLMCIAVTLARSHVVTYTNNNVQTNSAKPSGTRLVFAYSSNCFANNYVPITTQNI